MRAPSALVPTPGGDPMIYPKVTCPKADLDHILEHTEGLWNSLAGSRIFLTGGTGFVGKWLLESLLTANDRLNLRISAVVLTRDPRRFHTQQPHLADHSAVELVVGRVQDFVSPAGNFPFIIHAATENSFDPDIEGTRRMLEFARTHGVRRFLFTSSGAVYGKQPSDLTNIPEEYPGAPATNDAETAYGQSKRVSEFLCTTYALQYGFAALIARLFAFVGPHLPLDRNFAAGNFIRDALSGGPIRVNGDGTPYRSYLYAADLTIWLWTILIRGESAHPYNVGSDQAVNIAALARKVAELTPGGADIQIAQQPSPGLSPLRYVPSVQRARVELGLRPIVTLSEGVRRTVDWARE